MSFTGLGSFTSDEILPGYPAHQVDPERDACPDGGVHSFRYRTARQAHMDAIVAGRSLNVEWESGFHCSRCGHRRDV